MNLFYLRYFVTLAHIKHYTKAASRTALHFTAKSEPRDRTAGKRAGDPAV